MVVWGLAPRIEGGRPVVVGVALAGPLSEPTGRQILVHRCEPGDIARALLLLTNDVEQELSKEAPEVVVIRAMDWFRNPKERMTRPRLQVEGVLLAATRRLVPTVAALSGKEIGMLCASTKAAIEAEAERLLPELDRDAVMAGLAALTIAARGER